jgi:hypothetical protein
VNGVLPDADAAAMICGGHTVCSALDAQRSMLCVCSSLTPFLATIDTLRILDDPGRWREPVATEFTRTGFRVA